MKHAIIIGGGPAGLTAAYELLKTCPEYQVTVLEESEVLGGIARTACYKGNRMDMGGHRFFSKLPEVNAWWQEMLPLQGAPSYDDKKLGRSPELSAGGPDPDREDRVMLNRRRVSRIYFDGKFYDYPISLKWQTFKNMGLLKTLQCGFSYLGAKLKPLPETNLENFYINSFGRKLYEMFFEYYTENLWGRHPREIDASWGAQRTKGLSIGGVLKDMLGKLFKVKGRKVNTSLIEAFSYPKYGPGQLWELTGEEIRKRGGRILLGARALSFGREGDRLTSVVYEQGGERRTLQGDLFFSSMPLKDLVAGLPDVPEKEREIARDLPYRDYQTLGVLVKKLALKNETDMTTLGNIVPDCWVYVQDRNVKLGRFQLYNNWSPYMVEKPEDTVWLGLEYFCSEGDGLWKLSDEEFAALGIREMLAIGLIASEEDVLDTHRERVKKAYPAYFDSYSEIGTLTDYLKEIGNLYCIGRNGQHRYNNMDHSMATAFEAVKCVRGEQSPEAVWEVNTEKEYHESK